MPGPLVVDGAALQCSMGALPGSFVVVPPVPPAVEPTFKSLPGPGSLKVPPANRVGAAGKPAANVTDTKPMANIPGFGLCMSPQNPDVAKATAAASGVLTPQPCKPNVLGPWMAGSPSVTVGGYPAVNATCTCTCVFGGLIRVLSPGQTAVVVP